MHLFQTILHSLLLHAAIASAEASLTSNKGRSPVNATTYSAITKYGNFNLAGQLQPCRQPPLGASVVKEFNITSTDTQAALYKLDSTKELIIAFPGTATAADLGTDLFFLPLPFLSVANCMGCLVHGGIGYAFASILPSLNATIVQALKDNPTYRLTITGYSLGAALAKLTFVWARDNPAIAARVGPSYSYGEPRVGNLAFASFTDRLSRASDDSIGLWNRITHANDGIPQLPPWIFGFVHSATEIWEADGSNGRPGLNTTYRCYGKEPRDCINSNPGLGPNAAHGGYAGFDRAAVCSACQVGTSLCN